MIQRVPSAVLAALVALATLGPASLALAHPAPAGERAAAYAIQGPSARPDLAPPAKSAPSEDPAGRRMVVDAAAARGAIGSGAIPGGLVAALALVMALAARAGAPWRSRVVASLAVLALAVLTFETGVHSVHHLGDEAGAAQCSVASASTHLAGTPEQGPALRAPAPAPLETRSFQIAPVAEAPFRCHAIRAPPTPSGS